MRNTGGFTLIELMIVVAIIGVLAAIAIPQFSTYRIKAFNAAAQSDLKNAMTAEEAYFASNAVYSASNTNIDTRVSTNVTLTMALSGISDYTGTSRHSSGNHTYTVTGTVGIIR